MSRKGAKKQTHGRKLRSTGTKERERVGDKSKSRAELEKKLEALTRELIEAREQQTATSEVLGIISSSPGALEQVFQAMLANATRICEATFGTLYLCEADAFRAVATHNAPPAYVEARTRDRLQRPPPDMPLARVAVIKEAVQLADIRTTRSYNERHPFVMAAVEAGYRTVLAVPMIKEGELIGAFTILRQQVRPFTDKQIELVENFANQAVIAIEKTRLLSELRQRTDDLTDALEQQTATSEVLKVISSSPGALEPVFEAMLANATRVCEAKFGVLYLFEGDAFRAVALHGASPASFIEARRRHPLVPIIPGPRSGAWHATKQTVQIADVQAEPAYRVSKAHVIGVEMGGRGPCSASRCSRRVS